MNVLGLREKFSDGRMKREGIRVGSHETPTQFTSPPGLPANLVCQPTRSTSKPGLPADPLEIGGDFIPGRERGKSGKRDPVADGGLFCLEEMDLLL